METGTILLVHGKSDMARAIQKFQMKAHKLSGYYNHSGLIINLPSGVYVAEESYIKDRKLKAAVVMTPLEVYTKGDYELLFLMHERDKNDPDYEQMIEKVILANVGVPYDYWSLLHDQIIRTLNKVWVGRKKNANRRMVCHEFTQYCWNEVAGIFPEYYKGDVSKIYDSLSFSHFTRPW